MFRKIGVLKIWKKSLKICINKLLLIQHKACNFNTKWTPLHVFFKGFAYILLNLLWLSTLSRTKFYRKSPEIKKVYFLKSWNLLFYFEVHDWPICRFFKRDGGRQEEERKVSQKNTILHILSMCSMFTAKSPIIWSCNC